MGEFTWQWVFTPATFIALIGALLTGCSVYFARKNFITGNERQARIDAAAAEAKKKAIRDAFAPFIAVADELLVQAVEEAKCLEDDDAKRNRFGTEYPDLNVMTRLLERMQKIRTEPLADREAIAKADKLVAACANMVNNLMAYRKEVWAQGEPLPSKFSGQRIGYALQNMPQAKYALTALENHRNFLVDQIKAVV